MAHSTSSDISIAQSALLETELDILCTVKVAAGKPKLVQNVDRSLAMVGSL